MEREEGLILWLHVITFPRRLWSQQQIFGREFSKHSRILKAVLQSSYRLF